MIQAVYKVVEAVNFKPIIVITGYDELSIRNTLKDKNVTFVHNDEWQLGMSHSIKKGILALSRDISGCIIILGDMPLITDSILQKLKNTFTEYHGEKIVYPLVKNRQANPVIFPRKFFEKILTISGDKGCKSILKHHPEECIPQFMKSEEILIDCDTKKDYIELLSKTKGKENVSL